METNLFARMAMMILLATLVVPVQLWAQQHRYKVIDLGTLGGEFSSGFGVNDLGWADGYSTLPAETITHAFVWQDRDDGHWYARTKQPSRLSLQ